MTLDQKVIVITGASAGLGKSLALEAGKNGAKVALLARRLSQLEDISRHIQSEGGQPLPIATDVSNPESVKEAFGNILATWNRIDILINSAGLVEPIAPLIKNSDDALLTSLKTNVYGLYLNIRESLKIMLHQKKGGTLVNITSGAAVKPYQGWSAYCSQKAAVNMLTRCVALEMSQHPIRVTAISPGTFDSHMQAVIRNTPEDDFPARQKFIDLYEQNKLASPSDVAKTILEIAGSDWPELSGRIEDIRSPEFQQECRERNIRFYI